VERFGVTLTDVDFGPRSSPEDHLFPRKSLELLLLLEHSVGSCAKREFSRFMTCREDRLVCGRSRNWVDTRGQLTVDEEIHC